MNETIWKFQIETTDTQFVQMPKDATILCVQVQNGLGVCLWAQVDPSQPKENRCIEIFGTGHAIITANRRYVGTYQLSGGMLVFHAFERLSN